MNGTISLVGRIKDILKVCDFSVPPFEIEEILHSHEQVEDAAVVGTPREDYGEVATAFVIPRPSDSTCAQVTETELQEFVAGLTVISIAPKLSCNARGSSRSCDSLHWNISVHAHEFPTSLTFRTRI